MARKRRILSPEEIELWRRVKRTASPLRPDSDDAALPPAAPTPPPEAPPKAPTDLSRLALGGKAASSGSKSDPLLSAAPPSPPVRMDARAFNRMKRGKLKVEGRIDLHGMTLAEAHPRLTAFILTAAAAGKRLVLVITGKGRGGDDGDPVPLRRGILRQQVPHWLSTGEVGRAVLQVTQAHPRHGGSGAFYVYLRRK